MHKNVMYSLACTSGQIHCSFWVLGLGRKQKVAEVCKWTSGSLIDLCCCDESNLFCFKVGENSEVKIVLCRSIRVAPGFEVFFLISGGW